MSVNQIEGFHWCDDWFFRRQADGSVEIRNENCVDERTDKFVRIVIPARGWASIVASVSKTGETGETYRQALAFHETDQGRIVPPHGSGPDNQ